MSNYSQSITNLINRFNRGFSWKKKQISQVKKNKMGLSQHEFSKRKDGFENPVDFQKKQATFNTGAPRKIKEIKNIFEKINTTKNIIDQSDLHKKKNSVSSKISDLQKEYLQSINPKKHGQKEPIGKILVEEKPVILLKEDKFINITSEKQKQPKQKKKRKQINYRKEKPWENSGKYKEFLDRKDLMKITGGIDPGYELLTFLKKLFPETNNFRELVKKSRNFYIQKDMVFVEVDGKMQIGYSNAKELRPQVFEKSICQNSGIHIFLDEKAIKNIDSKMMQKYGLKKLGDNDTYFIRMVINKNNNGYKYHPFNGVYSELISHKNTPGLEFGKILSKHDLLNTSLSEDDIENLSLRDIIEETKDVMNTIHSLYPNEGEWEKAALRFINDYGHGFDKRYQICKGKNKKHLLATLGKAKYKYSRHILDDGRIMMPMIWITKDVAEKYNITKYGYVPIALGGGGRILFGLIFDPKDIDNPKLKIEKKSRNDIMPEHKEDFKKEAINIKKVDSKFVIAPPKTTEIKKKSFLREKENISQVFEIAKYGDLANFTHLFRVTGFYEQMLRIQFTEKTPPAKIEEFYNDMIAILSKMTQQILKGINDMHLKKLLHRDIKPENVLLDKDKTKITDFDQVSSLEEFNKRVEALKIAQKKNLKSLDKIKEEFDDFRKKGTLSAIHPELFGSLDEMKLDKLNPIKIDYFALGILLSDLWFGALLQFNVGEERLFDKGGKKYAEVSHKSFNNDFHSSIQKLSNIPNNKTSFVLKIRQLILGLLDGTVDLWKFISSLENSGVISDKHFGELLSKYFDKKDLLNPKYGMLFDKFEFQSRSSGDEKANQGYRFLSTENEFSRIMFEMNEQNECDNAILFKKPSDDYNDDSDLESDDEDDDTFARKSPEKKITNEYDYKNSKIYEKYVTPYLNKK
ncbi:protein kinase [Candidatus Margulisiibacteriota bacterium]